MKSEWFVSHLWMSGDLMYTVYRATEDGFEKTGVYFGCKTEAIKYCAKLNEGEAVSLEDREIFFIGG